MKKIFKWPTGKTVWQNEGNGHEAKSQANYQG